MLAPPLMYRGTLFPTVPQTARVQTIRGVAALPAAGGQVWMAFDDLNAAAFPTKNYVLDWDNLNLPTQDGRTFRARILACGVALLTLPANAIAIPKVTVQAEKILVSDAGAEVGQAVSLAPLFGFKQASSTPMEPLPRIDAAPLDLVLPIRDAESVATVRYPERIRAVVSHLGGGTIATGTRVEIAFTLAIFSDEEAV